MIVELFFTQSQIEIPPLALPSREVGAVVEFHGIVREMEGAQALHGLYYEAYEPMARLHLQRIFGELKAKYPVQGVLFIHRLGWVPVGDASLYIRVASSHRGEALAFCGAAIDRMKTDVPIWKMVTKTV